MSFSDVIQQLAGGQAYQELGDKLTEIVQAVQETRKVGSLTISLKIKPNGEHGVVVAETIAAKVPERARGETLFFVSSAGHLMRNDPRQEILPLRQVSMASTAPLRTVEAYAPTTYAETEGVTVNG